MRIFAKKLQYLANTGLKQSISTIKDENQNEAKPAIKGKLTGVDEELIKTLDEMLEDECALQRFEKGWANWLKWVDTDEIAHQKSTTGSHHDQKRPQAAEEEADFSGVDTWLVEDWTRFNALKGIFAILLTFVCLRYAADS